MFYSKSQNYYMEAKADEDDILGGPLSPNEAAYSVNVLSELRRFGVIPRCKEKSKPNELISGPNFDHKCITKINSDFSNSSYDNISLSPRICRALDCGAGYGRVTKSVLLKMFDRVDIADNAENLLAAARANIGADFKRVERSYLVRLEDFVPESGRQYDVIWLEWVIGHLLDDNLISFLSKLKTSLTQPATETTGRKNLLNEIFFSNRFGQNQQNSHTNATDAIKEYLHNQRQPESSGVIIIKDNVHWMDDPTVNPLLVFTYICTVCFEFNVYCTSTLIKAQIRYCLSVLSWSNKQNLYTLFTLLHRSAFHTTN